MGQIDSAFLNYYGDDSKSKLLGCLDLREVTAVDVVDAAAGSFQLSFRTGGTYALKTPRFAAWVEALEERVAWATADSRSPVRAPHESEADSPVPARSGRSGGVGGGGGSKSAAAAAADSGDADSQTHPAPAPRHEKQRRRESEEARDLAAAQEQLNALFADVTRASAAVSAMGRGTTSELGHTARRRLVAALTASTHRAVAALQERLRDASSSQRAAHVHLFDSRFLLELGSLTAGKLGGGGGGGAGKG
jgi:hypothetical protein